MKYIGYYDTVDNRRLMSPAAVNKMDYIAEALAKICGSTEIISCGMIADKPIKATNEELSKNIHIEYFRTFKDYPNIFFKIFKHVYSSVRIFTYLIKNVKKNEQVVVYHSLLNMKAVYWAKKIKKFRVILEVEEFYNDVKGLSRDTSRIEKKYIQSADKYIFPTGIMAKKFSDGKKSVIIHGVYKCNCDNRTPSNCEKIKVVYAGTFDPNKGGVTAAIDCARCLPSQFEIHIAGFGSEAQVSCVKERIKKSNKSNKCKIVYEGSLRGKKYNDFLQKCDIGLSTQNPKGKFNSTSFPSKILSYLSNGLKVVSARIPVVETSEVSEIISFYENQKPEEIARAIINAEKNSYNPVQILKRLDDKFLHDLKELLEN